MQLIIGAYTEDLPYAEGRAAGILSAEFDTASGHIGRVTMLAETRNPSYLAVTASGDRVYAVNETFAFEDREGGGLTAFARDRRTGELTTLNARPSLGMSPCHLVVGGAGRFVLAANYGVDAGSVVAYRLEPDGSLGARTGRVTLIGCGPDESRQSASHAHMVASDPANGDILVADLGSDKILAFRLGADGGLSPKGGSELEERPGAGPRHFAFHPDGDHLFVVNELDSSLSVLRRKGDRFESVGCASTVPPGGAEGNLAGAVRVSPSGRHVLISNRGHDSLAVFRFDAAASRFALVGIIDSVAACPRDLVFSPDGRYVIVVGQGNDLVASYAFDDNAGALRFVQSTTAPTPTCLVLVQP
ncbi:lactonase family protein [Streptomyces sp. NPDC097610]|uniref:lactonase family protein n=1 Tax=Streptomyces sp. NPDC097610 TaxID=3157227 RepID=UPI00332E5C53